MRLIDVAAASPPMYGSAPEHKAVLRGLLEEARRYTLSFLDRIDALDPDLYRMAVHRDFSPPGWHFGHIAAFSGLWILQRLAGQAPIAPELDAFFMPELNPKTLRSGLPPRDEVLTYLAETSARIDDVLETSDFDSAASLERGGVLFWNILQHEYQHGETLAVILSLYGRLRRAGAQREDGLPAGTASALLETMGVAPAGDGKAEGGARRGRLVEVPGGTFVQGSDSYRVYDNERPAHAVFIEPFWIDVQPVTNAEFVTFIADQGYRRSELWEPAGWRALTEQGWNTPGAWTPHPDGGWCTWRMGRAVPIEPDAPVTGVSWYEAAAYAKWRGAALPTEAEWEKAASWSPEGKRPFPWGIEPDAGGRAVADGREDADFAVLSRPGGESFCGCLELAGNVWEWTGSWFEPYPGFEPFPYAGYSAPWFGTHRVLRGGAWTTRTPLLRTTFRNWYLPECREIFSGFRCVERQRRDVKSVGAEKCLR